MRTGLVLIVDDEQKILSSISRELFDLTICDVITAQSGTEGLEIIKNTANIMVIISDYHMPGMNGIQFLSETQKIVPDASRIMLTGAADLDMAIKAINTGKLFRFLIKPCPAEIMISTITAGVAQYKLVTSEKELLQKTLNGSIKIMVDLLSASNPEIFIQSSRLRDLARKLATEIKVADTWEVELAALLCRIGCVTVPHETLKKWMQGFVLDDSEMDMIQAIPRVGEDLVKNLPRLQNVAEGIGSQNLNYVNLSRKSGIPTGNQIPLIGRILKIVIDFDRFYEIHQDTALATEEMTNNSTRYDPNLLPTYLEKVVNELDGPNKLTGTGLQGERKVAIEDIEPGMVITRDIFDRNRRLIVARGTMITDVLRVRLKNFFNYQSITSPLFVNDQKSE
jgi:response regulator RpfG family c-di-GMP phosphodiesterase